MNTEYYHYCPEFRLEEIIKSGAIRLATGSVTNKNEKPVAWVSSNPFWEHTATKNVIDSDGKLFSLTFDEQANNIKIGCARIVVKAKGFQSWGKLKHLCNMNQIIANEMEKVGIERGANPKEWFGSLTPIEKDKWIKAEVYRNGKWTEYKIFE